MLAKVSLNNIFQDSLNEVLSQQLTPDRSYMSTFEHPNRLLSRAGGSLAMGN